eukprot:Pompholyxophrys_punicea_v1_NODE_1401_length_735_cov_6.118943.p1 type:complete len:158 gc:universal NODE_1401_length_735_cov_6.118943:255-728(+)
MLLKMRAGQLRRHNELLKSAGIDFNISEALLRHQVRKILKNLDSLGLPSRVNEFRALRAFNDVVVACFGMQREVDYLQKILLFKEAYQKTRLSVTLKVHLWWNMCHVLCKDMAMMALGWHFSLNREQSLRALLEYPLQDRHQQPHVWCSTAGLRQRF